jgi:phosphomannomutase/phosphoglucomutase
VETSESAKFKIVEQIINHFKTEYEVIDIDGARIKFPEGWALVRASNTQPSLVVRFEADSNKNLSKIRGLVEPVIEQFKSEIE